MSHLISVRQNKGLRSLLNSSCHFILHLMHGLFLSMLCPYLLLYNLYKDSCPLIGWIAFIILTIYWIRWQNILLHSIWVGKSAKLFTIALIVYIYIRVFSISNTIFGRLLSDEANKKDDLQSSTRGNVTGAVCAFSVMQASAWYFLRKVGRTVCLIFCLS